MAGPTKQEDRICAVCKRSIASHSGRLCEACFCPVEHHDRVQADECWEGRARMADARQRAGLPLNAVDRKALKRFPEPATLRLGGYT